MKTDTNSLIQICDVMKVIFTEITEEGRFCQIVCFIVLCNELHPAQIRQQFTFLSLSLHNAAWLYLLILSYRTISALY